jgi:hypothetical protein
MQQETKVSSRVISGSGASDGAEFGSSFLRTIPVTRESSSRKHGQTGLSLSHAGTRCLRLAPILPLATGRRCHLPSSERVRSASLCHWERQYDASSLRHKDTALGDSTLQPDHRQRVSNCCPDVRVISWREHSRFRGLCRSGAKRYRPDGKRCPASTHVVSFVNCEDASRDFELVAFEQKLRNRHAWAAPLISVRHLHQRISITCV